MFDEPGAGDVQPAEERPASDRSALIDVGEVAALLCCSDRHVHRLARTGRMPAPLRLGSLVRWSRVAIRDWIARGCPAVRNGPAGGRS